LEFSFVTVFFIEALQNVVSMFCLVQTNWSNFYIFVCRWIAYASECIIWWKSPAYNIWRTETSTWEASIEG